MSPDISCTPYICSFVQPEDDKLATLIALVRNGSGANLSGVPAIQPSFSASRPIGARQNSQIAIEAGANHIAIMTSAVAIVHRSQSQARFSLTASASLFAGQLGSELPVEVRGPEGPSKGQNSPNLLSLRDESHYTLLMHGLATQNGLYEVSQMEGRSALRLFKPLAEPKLLRRTCLEWPAAGLVDTENGCFHLSEFRNTTEGV